MLPFVTVGASPERKKNDTENRISEMGRQAANFVYR